MKSFARFFLFVCSCLISFSHFAYSQGVDGGIHTPPSIGYVGKDYGGHQLYSLRSGENIKCNYSGFPPELTLKYVLDGLIISGTPTKAGRYYQTITVYAGARYGGGSFEEAGYIEIKNAYVINLNLTGLPYGSHKVTASGGTAPYNYTITGLPDGLKAASV
ncbi:hypothetical protein [Ochrobactrum sp. MYb379]|uniref:hypothetical protein n=1 Tax=Ochrobactrum sp. MYb379 TaxID=2745275 RepID=UPI00309B3462